LSYILIVWLKLSVVLYTADAVARMIGRERERERERRETAVSEEARRFI
jgi:hypothetical protein